MTGLFVTGTDTGCGKTSVGVVLAALACEAGLQVRVVKPIETGCEFSHGWPVPADALALARAAGDPRPLEQICPYRLTLPAAPDVAAAHEGVAIEPARLRAACEDACEGADLVLVEGAGGLLVPIAPGLDMLGLAAMLELPLLVVARAALGTINHTRLTLAAASARGRPVAGVVVSHTTPSLSPAERANLDRLLADLPVRFLGELRFGGKQLVPELDIRGFLHAPVTG